jgi:hypothetical protein
MHKSKRQVGKRSMAKRSNRSAKRSNRSAKRSNRSAKRSNRSAKRSNRSAKRSAKYTGLLGDLCPIGSSVNEAENDKKPNSERWDLQCYKNCGTFESTKDYYNDGDPRLKGTSAARVCGGDIDHPRREPVSR